MKIIKKLIEKIINLEIDKTSIFQGTKNSSEIQKYKTYYDKYKSEIFDHKKNILLKDEGKFLKGSIIYTNKRGSRYNYQWTL